MQWCVGAPGLGGLTVVGAGHRCSQHQKLCHPFGESVRVSRGYKECVSPQLPPGPVSMD